MPIFAVLRRKLASPLNLIFMLGGAPEAHDVSSKTPRVDIFFKPEVSCRGVSDQG